MKRFLFSMLTVLLLSMLAGTFSSCDGCGKGTPKEPTVIADDVGKFQTDYDGVMPDMSKGAEHVIALQRQTMFSLVDGKDYVWYETKFSFNDSLKVENLNDVSLVEITSTFQTFAPDLCYTITTDVIRGTLIPAPTPGIWIEDFDLSDEDITLGISDVLQRLQEVNMPLPPATSIILRKPVGPLPCHAQYVMGNPFDVLWVDAVTGEVTDWCPAFPRTDINKPLGEWP